MPRSGNPKEKARIVGRGIEMKMQKKMKRKMLRKMSKRMKRRKAEK